MVNNGQLFNLLLLKTRALLPSSTKQRLPLQRIPAESASLGVALDVQSVFTSHSQNF